MAATRFSSRSAPPSPTTSPPSRSGAACPPTGDPAERIVAILAGSRERILATDSNSGCPLGRLALEIDPENRPAHALIAQNFQGWIGAVRECVDELKPRLPRGTDLDALSTYVLAVMEGGVMLSRSYGSVDPFDRTVTQLRQHFALLLAPKQARVAKTPRKKSKPKSR